MSEESINHARYYLDENKYFYLDITKDARGLVVHYGESGRTTGAFAQSFLERSSLTVEGETYNFAESGRDIVIPATRLSGKASEEVAVNFNDQVLGNFKYHPQDGDIEIIHKKALNVSETRMIANDHNYKPVVQDVPFHPTTDLHTHYPGILTGEDLVGVAMKMAKEGKYDLSLPTAYLDSISVTYPLNAVDPQTKSIHIDDLRESERSRLASKLSFRPDEINTFSKMEEIYALRDNFVKDPKLFPEVLRKIAVNYAAQGVDYAELSFNKVLDPKIHAIAASVLPQIEAETGVKMSFLIGLSRHKPTAELDDKIDLMFTMAHDSPYITGVDFLARESNSTKDFTAQIRYMYEYAKTDTKGVTDGFTIRVHAGETPEYPDNVKDALKIAEAYTFNPDGSVNKNMPMMRIGHGINGIDAETMRIAKRLSDAGKLVIEINPDSNLTLNNISKIEDLPINRYADAGIAMVLATDSPGMYRTTLPQVAEAAFKHSDIIHNKEALKASLELGERVVKEYAVAAFDAENIKFKQLTEGVAPENRQAVLEAHFREKAQVHQPVFTPELEKKYQQRDKERVQGVTDILASQGAEVQTNIASLKFTEGKTPIVIEGELTNTFDEATRSKIKTQVKTLIQQFDPEHSYVVLNGQTKGMQGIVREALDELETQGKKYSRVASIDKEALLQQFKTLEPAKYLNTEHPQAAMAKDVLRSDAFNYQKVDAVFLAGNAFDISQEVGQHAVRKNGVVVVIGGNGVASDLITAYHTERQDLYKSKSVMVLANDVGDSSASVVKSEQYVKFNYGKPTAEIARTVEQLTVVPEHVTPAAPQPAASAVAQPSSPAAPAPASRPAAPAPSSSPHPVEAASAKPAPAPALADPEAIRQYNVKLKEINSKISNTNQGIDDINARIMKEAAAEAARTGLDVVGHEQKMMRYKVGQYIPTEHPVTVEQAAAISVNNEAQLKYNGDIYHFNKEQVLPRHAEIMKISHNLAGIADIEHYNAELKKLNVPLHDEVLKTEEYNRRIAAANEQGGKFTALKEPVHYQYAEAGQTFQDVKKIAEYNAQAGTYNAAVLHHNGETVQLNTRLFHAYEEARATGNRSHVEALERASLERGSEPAHGAAAEMEAMKVRRANLAHGLESGGNVGMAALSLGIRLNAEQAYESDRVAKRMNELGIGIDVSNLAASAVIAGKAGSPAVLGALEHAGLPLAIASTVVDVAIAVHQQDSRAVAVAMGQLAGGIGGGVVGAGLGTPGGPLAVVTGFAGAVVGGGIGGGVAMVSYDVTTALSDFVAKHVNISPRDPVFFDLLAQEQPGILANAHLKTLRESGLFTPQQLETIHAKQMQLGNLELKINSPLRDIQLQNELLAPVHLDLDQPAPAGNLLHGALPQKDTLQLASLPAQNGNAGNSKSETPQPKTSFDGIDLSGIKRAGISGGASVLHDQVGAALVAQGQGKITAAGIGA